MRRTLALAALLLFVGCTSHSTTPTDPGDGSYLVVSKVDIPAGEKFNPLIRKGDFQVVMVPADLVVPGALTSIDQLKGQTSSAPIYQNEQIPLGRLAGGDPFLAPG